jgi:predicted DsbA family dithiol-disulfide isomerase
LRLDSGKYPKVHKQALKHAYEETGGTGVPLLVIGNRTLTGLQDEETLGAVIEQEMAGSREG